MLNYFMFVPELFKQEIARLNQEIEKYEANNNYFEVSKTYQKIADLYHMVHKQNNSNIYYQKSIEYGLDCLHEVQEKAKLYEILAKNYENLKEYEEALRYYQLEALQYRNIDEYSDLPLQINKGNAYYAIARMYDQLNHQTMAMINYQKCYIIFYQVWKQSQDDIDYEKVSEVETFIRYRR